MTTLLAHVAAVRQQASARVRAAVQRRVDAPRMSHPFHSVVFWMAVAIMFTGIWVVSTIFGRVTLDALALILAYHAGWWSRNRAQ